MERDDTADRREEAASLEEPATEDVAAHAAAALLSAIVDSSYDAIASKNLNGIVTSWNRTAKGLFGYTAAEMIGQSITKIIPTELWGEENHLLACIRRGEKVEHFETIRQAKDGRRLNVSLTISPVRDSRGVIIGASKIARDITEKKRLEREREELLAREQLASRRLQEAVAARDELIAVAAHELRNPLNVFLLTIELLDRLSATPAGLDKARTLLAKTRKQLNHMSALIDRLLDVTRVRAGTFELYRERFELGGLLNEVVGRFRNENPALPLSLKLDAAIEGEWDRLRIDQAVTNLISNAVKYGMQKPIDVSARVVGGDAVVRVRDHGPGIPPEDQLRIFDRFEHVTETLSSRGLGLGLWITRQIVQAHGGTIFAKSEMGKGSTFVMNLPLHMSQSAPDLG
jgi:PAS domain S-box-containing protein